MPLSSNASRWLVFTLVAFAQFMVVLDVSVTNIALPAIMKDLHFGSDSALQWVVTAYALTFGGFLLLGGRSADLFGRRKVLLLGMACFSLISLVIGFSHSEFSLISLRAAQGVAAAFMSPAALSIVLATFEEGPARGQALGFWALVATGGASAGLLLGGALTQFLGWQWNFFINVPVGIVMILLIRAFVPLHEREESDTTLDMPGALLSTAGLMLFVLAVSNAPTAGILNWSTIVATVGAAALLCGFVYWESRAPHPLMPLSIFRIGNVTPANLMLAPIYGSLLGVFFLVSLYVQKTLDFSPVLTGMSFLPFPVILGVVTSVVPRLVDRFGYRVFLRIGPLFIGAAVLSLTQLPVGGSYFTNVLPALVLLSFGMGLTFMPVTTAATSGIAPERSGLASGLIATSQQMGGAIGLAVLSGVATFVAGGSSSSSAIILGYDRAFMVAAAFIAFALVLAYTMIRELPRTASAHAGMH